MNNTPYNRNQPLQTNYNSGNPGNSYSPPPQQPPYQPYMSPQQPQYQPPYQQPPSVPGKGLGIAGMVLGIIGLVLFCFWYVGIVCSLVGLALSCVSMYKANQVGMKNGMAVAGLVTSVIAIAIDIIGAVFLASLFSQLEFIDYL